MGRCPAHRRRRHPVPQDRQDDTWEEYGAWHLGLTEGAGQETKRRYAFVLGDFRRLHRMGIISCYYRAAEWGHKDIELAAHDLLQYLDNSRR